MAALAAVGNRVVPAVPALESLPIGPHLRAAIRSFKTTKFNVGSVVLVVTVVPAASVVLVVSVEVVALMEQARESSPSTSVEMAVATAEPAASVVPEAVGLVAAAVRVMASTSIQQVRVHLPPI